MYTQIRDREDELWEWVCEEIWPFMPVYSGKLKHWHPNIKHGFIIDAHGQEIPVHVSEFEPFRHRCIAKEEHRVKFEKNSY